MIREKNKISLKENRLSIDFTYRIFFSLVQLHGMNIHGICPNMHPRKIILIQLNHSKIWNQFDG